MWAKSSTQPGYLLGLPTRFLPTKILAYTTSKAQNTVNLSKLVCKDLKIRAVERLIFLIALLTALIF